jgi:hypothetical protein
VWPDILAGYFKSGPENPATLEYGSGLEEGEVCVTQKCGRIFQLDILDLVRIIRPLSKTAKDQKEAGCASPRSWPDISTGLFQIRAGLSGRPNYPALT